MRVFVSAGEPSGDHHAACLVRALLERHPDVECIGLGGPGLAAAGATLLADMTALAVMWFGRALLNLPRFVELARRAERSFIDRRPDVVVVVDFPGFHWWLAWRAKRHGIPVVFYCPPQIWAWGSWRVGKLRRLVDHVLAALPFEHDWFTAHGVRSTLVGHPFFDAPPPRRAPDGAVPLLLLLPGSRRQEIDANLGSLLEAARKVRGRIAAVRVVVGALHERHAALIAARAGTDVEIVAGRSRELMTEAAAAIAVSGSVSLELLSARVPTVIVYRISRLAYVVQSFFRHARWITLVNLLAVDDPIGPVRPVWRAPVGVPAADPAALLPEYLAVDDPAPRVADHVVGWLADPAARLRTVERLDAVARGVERPGSAARAADAVLAIARGTTAAAPPPARRSGRRAA
jgi:lipid-A-disaccharide synthase